jgi:hypothetical protein
MLQEDGGISDCGFGFAELVFGSAKPIRNPQSINIGDSLRDDHSYDFVFCIHLHDQILMQRK